MEGQGPPFYGKYRGDVADNNDPLMIGRIRAKIQDILGDKVSGWAMPSFPYAGKGVGLYLVPPVGARVWIEFEHGEPDTPIWSGCFWNEGTLPNLTNSLLLPYIKILKTDTCTITLDDTPGIGGVTIETTVGAGAKIVMNMQGIEISCSVGDIKLSPTGVSINDGALEVV